jgi:glycine betaine catabolism B
VRLLPDPTPPGAVVLRCHDVVVVTPEVRTFVFAPENCGPARHVAGQYLTLTVEVEGRCMTRNYTISSPPTRPYLLDITVKRETGGTVSRWLHDHLTPGMTISATLPHGDFTLSHHPADRYLLLAGGVGITPFLSMLRACHDLRHGADVVLVHNTRGPQLLVARPELEALAASESWFTYVPMCDEVDRTGSWRGLTGRLDGRRLLDVVPDMGDREVLVCGPPAYVDAALALLEHVGVSPSRCHVESFTTTTQEPSPPVHVASPSSAADLRVSFARSGRSVRCPPGGSILTAALDAGIPVPFSCGEGLCGTCKSTLLEGRVDMRHQGGIRPREIAQNKILLCCSTPLEDVVVDV